MPIITAQNHRERDAELVSLVLVKMGWKHWQLADYLVIHPSRIGKVLRRETFLRPQTRKKIYELLEIPEEAR